ncbi:MAG TPA: Spy/CpxP family protein refolding chaperone, partial [Planctomycetota bacterium]|nr:Spy/CpxP family protein refolding chaperone [Planctomycetota bacterium]
MTTHGWIAATIGVLLLAALPADAGPSRGRRGPPGKEQGAREAGRPEARMHRMKELRRHARDAAFLRRLALTDAQRTSLEEARASGKAVREDLAQELRVVRGEAAAVGPDREVRRAARERSKAARQAALRAIEPVAQRFVGTLTAEQKQRAVAAGVKDEAALVSRMQRLILKGGPDPIERRMLEGMRHRAIHGALRLDEGQRRALREAHEAAAPARKGLHDARREAFLKTERTPQGGEAATTGTTPARETALAAVEPAARTFVASLSPEQRQRVADLAAKHGGTADDAGLVRLFQEELLARPGHRGDSRRDGAQGPRPMRRGAGAGFHGPR